MPKITVTGQAQPQNEGSIQASQADPMPKMPRAAGSRYVEPAQKTATGTSSPPKMPVPAASVYQEPPARVTSSNTNQEPSR